MPEHHHRRRTTRVLKDPEIRKQEILDTAMQLFSEYGYETTSMRMIAREMQVATGLCYRYFDSKQKLFEEAIDQYVRECCGQFVIIVQDRTKSIEERMNLMYSVMLNEHHYARYHDFFHRPENKGLHEQLSFKMCQYMYTFVLEELKYNNAHEKIKYKNPERLVEFILFGQIGLLADTKEPIADVLETIKEYIEILLTSQITSA